jgi:hypothetical protein
MRRGARLAGALGAAALVAASPVQARLLMEDTGVQISTPDDQRCGTPVALEVASDSPDLFVAGSPRLQGLLDASRAMLGFECRTVPEIRVTGRLRGMSQVSYEGSASAATRWRLEATRALRAPPGGSAVSAPAAQSGTSRWSIRDLSTGMSVNAAMASAKSSFDAEPAYDSRKRELAVVSGGCEMGQGSQPKPGLVCLRAWFTDGIDPRSYRLSYGQTVDQDQATVTAEQLRQRFGMPVVDEQRRSENWLRGSGPERHLAWGRELVTADGERRHEMEARIRVEGTTTVLELDLVDPALATQAPRYQVRF